MNNVKSLNKWANAHTHYSVDVVRIGIGVFLFIKGISFITNTQYLEDILAPIGAIDSGFFGMFLVHYIATSHFLGGILIVFGLLTRWAVIAQLPILIGAIVVNFTGEMQSQNLFLSLLIFIISLFFLIYGSGKHSADYYFKMQE